MRVIAGKYRSRVLKEVDLNSTRSTKDRVKESIFNSIQMKLVESDVLDLFGGSGALGIEAISRGAAHIYINELNNDAYNVIKDNIDSLKIKDATLHNLDYVDFLISCKSTFDIIILDPPYHMNIIDDIISLISRKQLLRDDGIIICLYAKNNSLQKENNGIIEYKKKTIGITNVSYFEME